ncbi:MAG: RDD family protein [Syntrophotaleaceae bacterium]
MKCPKCGYQSFNHLPACKKCGRSLLDLQEKLGFDIPAVRNLTAAAEATEDNHWQEENNQEDSALEDSLQNFFHSLEDPSEDVFSSGEVPASVTPPTDDIEPEDSLFDTPNNLFTFEEKPGIEDLAYSLDDMEEELMSLQAPEEEQEDSENVFLFSSADSREPDPPLDDFGKPPENACEEIPEEKGFLSFDDLNGELGAVEEPPREETVPPESPGPKVPEESDFLSFADVDAELGSLEETDGDVEMETAGQGLPETAFDAFVTPQEIKQAMAEDAICKRTDTSSASTAGTESDQVELPFAESVLPAEALLSDEEAAPRRLVLGLRLLAMMTDLGILLGIFSAFIMAGEMVRLPNRADWFRFTLDAVLQLATPYFLVLFTLCFGYFTLFHFLTGQTPGKMLWRVRVEGEAGAPLSLTQAFLRTAGGLLALLPAGLGFMSVLFNPSQRGWNDLLANSRVVKATPEGK